MNGFRVLSMAAATVALAATVTALPAAAQTPSPALPTGLDATQDCLELLLRAGDDPALTRAERIAALDKALLESLGRTDLCGGAGLGVGAGAGEAIGGGGGGGVAGADGDGGGGAGAGDAANPGAPVESLPAAGVQGDLPETVETAAVDPAPETTADPAADTTQPGAPANVPGAPSPSDGKVPADIPPSANDDIIARQLREAAQAETDPATRAKLWNEYRRYKGLPVQEVADTAAADDGAGDGAGDADADAGDTADAESAEAN